MKEKRCSAIQEKIDKQNMSLLNIAGNEIRSKISPILDILLIDRTKSKENNPKNIIWANDNYKHYNEILYNVTASILPELITGKRNKIIMPRALKSFEQQKKRTKTNAEVFTPTWIVKKQNDAIDANYKDDDLITYISRKWLEITCGEAPYMATRYDMETGEIIPITERVGFVDRKLKRINAEITDKAEWQRLVELAYKSSYGFEWNGDSLLIARENLLYTYYDYYFEKWGEIPIYGLFEEIAKIISYNLFQMDGLTYTIPYSKKKELVKEFQLSLFNKVECEQDKWKISDGKRVRIMNWDNNKMEYFDKGMK